MQPWEDTKFDDAKTGMIVDMKRVLRIAPNCTRNFYRNRGLYRERDWQWFFPTFKDFVRAAQDK
jgi:hypothetical protein